MALPIGVTVTSSPSNGVVTDVNGKFTIKVPSGAELTFSYLGYKTVKVKVGAHTTINVKMESDSQQARRASRGRLRDSEESFRGCLHIVG